MRLKKRSEEHSEGNIFWITMTDLMTGLVMVFIVMFFYTYMTSHMEIIKQNLAKENATNELKASLEAQNLDATVDAITGVVKISDLELFELGSYTLSEKGKAYLDKFAPTYFNSIFSNNFLNKNVEKIIIQGHTDSQTFKGKYNEDEQYMKNMELSLNRAFSVANYMSQTPYNKENGDKLRKMILVEGASFSQPIILNGKEDYQKSRRVELKIVMKDLNKKN